jgi:hypothetical protein
LFASLINVARLPKGVKEEDSRPLFIEPLRLPREVGKGFGLGSCV